MPAINAPTLAMHSWEDNRISASNAEAAFARLGSTDNKLVWVERAGHVITVDYGHERVFELTVEWLDDHAAASLEDRRERRVPS